MKAKSILAMAETRFLSQPKVYLYYVYCVSIEVVNVLVKKIVVL